MSGILILKKVLTDIDCQTSTICLVVVILLRHPTLVWFALYNSKCLASATTLCLVLSLSYTVYTTEKTTLC